MLVGKGAPHASTSDAHSSKSRRRTEKEVSTWAIALLLLCILTIGIYQSHKQHHPHRAKHGKDKPKQTTRQPIPTPDPDAEFWGQRFMWGDFRRNFPTEKAYNEYLEIISKVSSMFESIHQYWTWWRSRSKGIKQESSERKERPYGSPT